MMGGQVAMTFDNITIARCSLAGCARAGGPPSRSAIAPTPTPAVWPPGFEADRGRCSRRLNAARHRQRPTEIARY
jgi:hypothetical protein